MQCSILFRSLNISPLNPRTARFEVLTVEADFGCDILSLSKYLKFKSITIHFSDDKLGRNYHLIFG